MGRWLEKWGSKLISTQVVVEVEVGVEVGVHRIILFRSGGWVVGDLGSKANLNSSCS